MSSTAVLFNRAAARAGVEPAISHAGKPAASFPGAIAGDNQLIIADNRIQTTLAVTMNASDAVMTVADPSQLIPNSLVSLDVDGEIVRINGPAVSNTFPVTRGFDSTTPVMHLAGATVAGNIDAWHHNALVSEIQALETFLGPNGSYLPSLNQPYRVSSPYVFPAQAPGGSLIAGANVITLTPVPKGVNGTNVGHYLYISGGTGASEAALITGGTAVENAASGTVIVTCVNAHSGAWTIASATSGIQEAVYATGTITEIRIPPGFWPIHGPITVPAPSPAVWQEYTFVGSGRLTSTLQIASDFPLSAQGVFIPKGNTAFSLSTAGPTWSDFGVVFVQDYTKPLSGFTHWPPVVYSLELSMGTVLRLYISGAWQAFVLRGPTLTIGQWRFEDCDIAGYGPGVIDIDNAADVIRIVNCHFWPFHNANPPAGDTSAMYNPAVIGLLIANVAGLNVTNCYFLTGTSVKFTGSAGSSAITFDNTGFDVFGIVDMSRASGGIQVTFTNCVFYQDNGAAGYVPPGPSISYGPTGPQMLLAHCTLYRGYPGQPLISIVAPTASAAAYDQVSFLGNLIYDSSNSASSVSLISITNTTSASLCVKIADNQIAYENNLTYTNPMLSLTGSGTRLTFQNNTNSGWGSGTWLSIASDDQHFISGNVISGPAGSWTCTLPASKIVGYYQDQNFRYDLPSPVFNLTGPTTYSASAKEPAFVCNATAGQVTINLPFAASSRGARYTLVKTDASANACVFQNAGSDPINGVAAVKSVNTQFGSIRLVCDGGGWWVV